MIRRHLRRSTLFKIVVASVLAVFLLNHHIKNNLEENGRVPGEDSKFLSRGNVVPVGRSSFEQVRVVCAVTTSPSNVNKKAVHVKSTWGKRCNKLLFMSSEKNSSLPAVGLNVSEGRKSLWVKTAESLRYLYTNLFNDGDWFLKADDDTFIILENLRYFLRDKNPSDPVYFGRKLRRYVQQGYMSGGAGYVISREALKRVVERGLYNSSICPDFDDGSEDVYIGRCMENLAVKAGDSRDEQGRERFHPLLPETVIVPGLIKNTSWFWFYNYYKPNVGPEFVSPTSISFHYVGPNFMHVMDFFVYNLTAVGVTSLL